MHEANDSDVSAAGWSGFHELTSNGTLTLDAGLGIPPAPAPQVTITKYYTFNGQPIAMRKVGEGQPDALYFLHADHLGSTVLVTDRGGNTFETQQYYAYGHPRGGGALPTDHTFTGQKVDGTGLMYYRARYYDPVIGQFVSPDTILPDATSVLDYNRYMMVRGNPLNYVDPTGHGPEWWDNLVSWFQQFWYSINPCNGMAYGCVMPATPQSAQKQAADLSDKVRQNTTMLGGECDSCEDALNNAEKITPLVGQITRVLENPFEDEDFQQLSRLPQRTSSSDSTQGILIIDGQIYPVSSGVGGPSSDIPLGTSGFNSLTRKHAEGDAAAIMRQIGAETGTLYINNPSGPCNVQPGCDNNLPRMLPEGSTLRVVWGNMYEIHEKSYDGIAD